MKILVVDDEPLARERLTAMLGAIEGVEVIGQASNGRDALQATARLMPDLVLLDIRMPLMDGLEAAHHLGKMETPPALIFCSAHGDHALAAFEASAVDYLVKPVREERLRAALAKAHRWSDARARALDERGEKPRQRTHLYARVRGDVVLIPLDDITHLLAEDKYTTVYHAKGETLIEEPLTALEEEFEGRFVRIRRNCLVALAKLTGLGHAADGKLFAIVKGVPDNTLEVSRRNLHVLRKLVRTL